MFFDRARNSSFVFLTSAAGVAIGVWMFSALAEGGAIRHGDCVEIIEQLKKKIPPIHSAAAKVVVEYTEEGNWRLDTDALAQEYEHFQQAIKQSSVNDDEVISHATSAFEQALGNYQQEVAAFDGTLGSSLQLVTARDGVVQSLNQLQNLCSSPSNTR